MLDPSRFPASPGPDHPGGHAPESSAAQPPPVGTAALRQAVWRAEVLAGRLPVRAAEVAWVAWHNRLRIPEHYLALIDEPGDAIGRQAVPALEELIPDGLPEDPLAEDDPAHSPVPHLTHRYPDRALLLVTDLCPMFCRFCMRKRKTLRGAGITTAGIFRGIEYIRATPAIREVILSGGDPLMLPDRLLGRILGELGGIAHLNHVRLHTRMPCVEPARVTDALARVLGSTLPRERPLWMAVHFNHPREVTPAAARALRRLAQAGIPLNNQAVLLRGVNDDPAVLASLYRHLLRLGVHPYYLHHADQLPGTEHFRLPVREGMAIVARLRALAPELAMLHYVLDTPGGGGKVPLA